MGNDGLETWLGCHPDELGDRYCSFAATCSLYALSYDVTPMRTTIKSAGRLFFLALQDMKLPVEEPEGAFFGAFPSISESFLILRRSVSEQSRSLVLHWCLAFSSALRAM